MHPLLLTLLRPRSIKVCKKEKKNNRWYILLSGTTSRKVLPRNKLRLLLFFISRWVSGSCFFPLRGASSSPSVLLTKEIKSNEGGRTANVFISWRNWIAAKRRCYVCGGRLFLSLSSLADLGQSLSIRPVTLRMYIWGFHLIHQGLLVF